MGKGTFCSSRRVRGFLIDIPNHIASAQDQFWCLHRADGGERL